LKIAFIGIGNVGFAIANRLQKLGHDIIIASNNESSDSVQKALANNDSFKMAPIQAAIDQSDLVFLATPFQVNQNILDGLRFDGKTLVDCTNSVGAGITHGLKSINIPLPI
jgi:predicted dinucleotide-binding enzyme